MPRRAPIRSSRRLAMLALVPALLAAGSAAAGAPADPFSGLRTLSAAELSTYRGGFLTVEGWEIAFSVRIEINIDNSFTMLTRLNPLGVVTVETKRSPATIASGSLASAPAGSTTGPGTARDRESAAEIPVHLSQTPAGLTQRVGTIDTTLIETTATLNRIGQLLANTRNDATIRALTTVTIDLLNHSERVGSGAGLPSRSMLHLVGRLGRDLTRLGR